MPVKRPSNITTESIRTVLQKARANIKAGRNIYLCRALASVVYHQPALSDTAEYLRRYVMNKLGGFPYLDSWQRQEMLSTTVRTWDQPYQTDAQRRQHRIRWIDWMLEGLQ
jgi:hypothetical protein